MRYLQLNNNHFKTLKYLQAQFNLNYNPTEKALRETHFVKSLNHIESFNSLNIDVQLKVNQFSDWVSSKRVHFKYKKSQIYLS